MAASLEQRTDGSMALFINGDLQFDSKDEFIYHEALALPALAIAHKRTQSDLKVLIIGGGDGLAAREILKSSQIASLDLVDYDPHILEFANQHFRDLNGSSLLDSRVTVHVKDAWQFVDELSQRQAYFDLIVSDLTVAETVEEARFHSVEWYNQLGRLLTDTGVLAVNAVSPQATPQAYWSIFNGMVRAGLHARPYHIHLPSFAAQGYGQDWGFFVASRQSIQPSELNESLPLFKSAKSLKTAADICQLFVFPVEQFEFQKEALPAHAGSDILLRYFNYGGAQAITSGKVQTSLSLNTYNLTTPEPDSSRDILSPDLSAALAATIYSSKQSVICEPQDVELVLHQVMNLMPTLEREHTSQLIADFLKQPEVFLQAIDIPGLVNRLLKRAAELPAVLVAELELLRLRLEEWAGDELTLVSLGSRVLTVLTLTIVIGNLLYPDMAYAKGASAGHSGGHSAGGHSGAGHSGHDAGHSGAGHSGAGHSGAGHAGAGHAGHDAGHAGHDAGHGDHHDGARGNAGGGHVTGAAGAVRGGLGANGVRSVGVYGNRYWNGTRWLNNAPAVRPVIIEKKINSLPQPNDVSSAPNSRQAGGRPLDSQSERAVASTMNKLLADKQELAFHLALLTSELAAFEQASEPTVTYGSHKLPKAEAVRRTQLACLRAKEQIESLTAQISQLSNPLPQEENA